MPSRVPILALVGLLCLAGCTGTPGTQPSSTPDPFQEITVENRLETNATLTVRIVREATGEVVYNQTRTFPPGEYDIYNTRAATPDGVERFQITATRGNHTATTYVRTSKCYAGVYVKPTEDGGVSAGPVIC